MQLITLDSDIDFDGWRTAARSLVLNDVTPAEVTWRVKGGEPDLFGDETPGLPEPPQGSLPTTFNVPARFVEQAKLAILHRDPRRLTLLYRLLWRLKSHRDLLDVAIDPDVAELAALVRAVRRDEHKMHAFVRFREIGREPHARYTRTHIRDRLQTYDDRKHH